MSWDEALFKGFLGMGARIFRRERSTPKWEARAELRELSPRLTYLARTLAGEPLEIREAEAEGGVSGNVLFFPPEMDLFSDQKQNLNAYLLRTVYAVYSRRQRTRLPAGLSDAARREATLRALDSTLAQIQADLPGFVELRKSLPAESVDGASLRDWAKLWGLLETDCAAAGAAKAPVPSEVPAEALADGTEKSAKARERVEVVDLGEGREDENPLVHSFEKVRTADEYEGGKKSLDGSDEMAAHAEALEEVNFRKVVRSRERTRSLFRADPLMDATVPDLQDDGGESHQEAVLYDEWAGKSYREKWCRVHVESPPRRFPQAESEKWAREALGAHVREVNDLRKALSRILTERTWRNRQRDGSDIDLEAVVDRFCTLKSGHAPSDKLYLLRRRHEADFATLILLDGSLSTDSWVANRRVMDVARESVLILGKVLEGIHENSAVAAFHSNTRRDCRFQLVKRFDEHWNLARERLASLEPTGYTRIGPAIRHATTLLTRNPARKKLLLLLSDGKPTDYDRYEGKYGIDDVRQAIREAAREGVKVRALAVDAQAKNYLPRMFGMGNYQILPHPGELSRVLGRIYGELLR